MPSNKLQHKNELNLFLNEYFNVIVLIGMIIVFAFSYFFFLGPKFKLTTAAIMENVEAQKRLQAEQVKKLRDLETIKRLHEDISPADLARFNSVLPNRYIKEALFGEIEEIIVQQGFLIQSVDIKADKDASGPSPTGIPEMGSGGDGSSVGQIRITISVGAIDYVGFKQLLRTLEANSRLFDIDSVDFSEGGNSVTLELITYYYKLAQ